MQILQWLFKGAQEQERKGTKREEDIDDQNAKGKDIVLLEHHRRTKRNEERKLGCKNLKIFALVCREDISKAWFYNTLNLKRLGSFNRKLQFLYSMNMMKREKTSIRVDSASSHNVRNKVLPVSEASFSKSQTKDEADQVEKRKPILRIKELLRWASASKTEKGGKFRGRKVMQFTRRGTIKSVQDNDEVDVKCFSTITFSAHSVISMASSSNIRDTQVVSSSNSTSFASTKGNWITTDSEFVVLEL